MIIDAPTFLSRLFGQESVPGHAERPPATKAEVIEPMPPAQQRSESITPDDLDGPWRELYEERAAIREYDGGQAREHAEAEALKEIIDKMREAGDLR